MRPINPPYFVSYILYMQRQVPDQSAGSKLLVNPSNLPSAVQILGYKTAK